MIKKLLGAIIISFLVLFYASIAVALGATAFGGLEEVYMEINDD